VTGVAVFEAVIGDAGEILTLQRAAYASEALLYDDPGIPPLTQTLEELEAEMAASLVLKAVADGRVVGSIRARIEGGTGHIGRLIVAPELQGQGLGTRLMNEIERRLIGGVNRFELFTGDRSEGNLRLYRRLGYRETRRELVNDKVRLVYLEKAAPA
jgi:ribosomal protein S18 acetylase RimI-like enzyme